MSKITFMQLFISIFWIGFVSAISFFESWIKFRAPGITLPIGLRVGKKVFNALNRVELVLFLIIVLLSLLLPITHAGLLIGIGVVLMFQTLYLLPILNQRAEKIIAGATVTSTWHHIGYVVSDIIKIICLISLSLKIAGI
ncbi:MAG: hypothetical protein WHT29_09960 [Bacteroidales bacterium]